MKTPSGYGNAASFIWSVNAGWAVFRLSQEISAESEGPGPNGKTSEKIPTNHCFLLSAYRIIATDGERC